MARDLEIIQPFLYDCRGNVYSGLALSGIVEIPSAVLSMFCIAYTRRITTSAIFISWGIVGIIFPVTLAVPALRNTFLFFCKSCASANFTLMYLITGEFILTSARNTAVGMSSTIARIGCILAPFLSDLDNTVPTLSFVILGIIALTAGIAWYRFVPETQGQPMPETLEDMYKLIAETKKLTIRDTLAKCCRGNKNEDDNIRYSALRQDEDGQPGGKFGSENFDNINFDYDDFSSEDELSDFEVTKAVTTTK